VKFLPLVSVVIPTRNRPALVRRAVESALCQTYSHLEIIVIIDGPDHSTVQALSVLGDERLRVLELAESVGGGEARNAGVREATGEWIAFLDDDDEWLPEKIKRQTEAAVASQNEDLIVSCRYISRRGSEDSISPKRMPSDHERIDEYICCPKGYSQGEGFLQTSTFFVSRHLMSRVPFVPSLKRGQDFVWLIQACNEGGATVYVHPEVLSIFTAGDASPCVRRISANPNWRSLYAWIRNNKRLFTSRTYAYCIANVVMPDVMKCKEPFGVRLSLAADAFLNGSPRPKSLVIFGLRAFLPHSLLNLLKKCSPPGILSPSNSGA
jgi:glycosyltransferase involved in cell wall biosynthesis